MTNSFSSEKNKKIFFPKNPLNGSIPEELLEEIPCPLCGSFQKTKVYPKYYPRLVRCLSCGLIYTNPRLNKENLGQLYTKEYFQNDNSSIFGYQNYLADENKIRKTFARRLKTIEKIKKVGFLLDIGCAMGFFMDEAEKRGWKTKGIEISEFAATFAEKNLGLDVMRGNIQEVNLPQNSFDLVILWDVIEHLDNPLVCLKKIHLALKKDGLLVFSTPNISSIPAKLTRHRWVGYKLSDEHLTYFSPETISLLCQKTGFKVVKSHSLGKYVSLALFAARLSLYSKIAGKIFKFIDYFLPKKFNLYLSAFDIICVYAQKI